MLSIHTGVFLLLYYFYSIEKKILDMHQSEESSDLANKISTLSVKSIEEHKRSDIII